MCLNNEQSQDRSSTLKEFLGKGVLSVQVSFECPSIPVSSLLECSSGAKVPQVLECPSALRMGKCPLSSLRAPFE